MMMKRMQFLCAFGPITKRAKARAVLHRRTGALPTTSVTTDTSFFMLWTDRPGQVINNAQAGRTLLLYGELYDAPDPQRETQWIADRITAAGTAVIERLNGCFVLIVFDHNLSAVSVITDRINSRRAFHSRADGIHFISNSLYVHPVMELDVAGVAWYLTNRATFNGRTLFKGVSVLDRASIHTFTERGHTGKKYWSYTFDGGLGDVPAGDLRKELRRLLVQSVERRIRPSSQIFLSLSGGNDASGILGIIALELGRKDLDCFTFSKTATPRPGGDAARATERAKAAGCRHSLIPRYSGDFMRLLWLNGAGGNGATMSTEFASLQDEFGRGDTGLVFLGDQCFGLPNQRLANPLDALDATWIHSEEEVPDISEIVDETISLGDERDSLLDRYIDYSSLHALKDHFYVDQRLSNFILPQKECVIGSFFTVVNPYLDNAILDFARQLPDRWRLDKRLYRETIAGMFPALFAIPHARGTEWDTDWPTELERHRSEILEWIWSTDSLLDAIVEKDRLAAFLKRESRPNAKPGQITRRLRSLGRRVGLAGPKIVTTNRSELARRVLVMRAFINRAVARHSVKAEPAA